MQPIKKITIVGGGTSGWIAAAMLAHSFPRDRLKIQLVEAEEIKTIGIGESTVPPFVNLIRHLGIAEQDFIRATGATYKLGIEFVGWQRQRDRYFHPFGSLGWNNSNQDFYQCWLRARQEDPSIKLQDFSPCSVMAQQGKFFFPHQARNTPIGGANYALHVDADRVGKYLAKYAQTRGVEHKLGRVQQVIKTPQDFISHLVLDDGTCIEGDFFIDCTGFRALLIGDTLAEEFIDWSRYLPCDRAVAVRTEADARPPFTRATAQKYGWSWQIPLANSTGHGYVYASRFCDDQQAKSTLLRSLTHKRTTDSRIIQFRCGHRKNSWSGNCLSLGLAAGFVEPLEATSIHLITRAMSFFLRYYPDTSCNPVLAREFNQRMKMDFEEVRDFIMLHYSASSRRDSSFWQWWQKVELPESLQQRIELFRAQGAMRDGVDELFRASSWQSVFEGMGIHPNSYCSRVNNLDLAELQRDLVNARKAIAGMVDSLPAHEDFLKF